MLYKLNCQRNAEGCVMYDRTIIVFKMAMSKTSFGIAVVVCMSEGVEVISELLVIYGQMAN
jgi:hypothetical protein